MVLTRAQKKQLASSSNVANKRVPSIDRPQTVEHRTTADAKQKPLLHLRHNKQDTSNNSNGPVTQTSSDVKLEPQQSESSFRTTCEPTQQGVKRKRDTGRDRAGGRRVKRKQEIGTDSHSGGNSAVGAGDSASQSTSAKLLQPTPGPSRVPCDKSASTVVLAVKKAKLLASSPQLPPSFVAARRNAKLLADALKRCKCSLCRSIFIRPELPQADDATDSVSMQTRFHTVFESSAGPGMDHFKAYESRVTVKSPQMDAAATAEVTPSVICPLVAKKLGDGLCPDIVLENGQFEDVGTQEKALWSSESLLEFPLSALLRQQREVTKDILSIKGRCILAAGLATAILPLLETAFTHRRLSSSVVCFHVPARDELPNLALPFFRVSRRSLVSSAEVDNSCPSIHRQPSIQELGILLVEIFYCQLTPRKGIHRDVYNRNTRWQVCVDRLPGLEFHAPRNYYLAAKTCLEWEDGINDRGSFDGAESQEYFYQEVVKRLESVIYERWNLTLSDLSKMDASEQEHCWGPMARQAYAHYTSQTEHQKIPAELGP